MKRCLISSLFIFRLAIPFHLHAQARSKVALAGFFSNNMVLQRDKPIHFWGTAAPSASVTVSFADHKITVTADGQGSWDTEFLDMKAGGPYELQIDGTDPQIIKNIMVGDVWLVSGQSNMEYTFGNTDSVAADIVENTNIRYYSIGTSISNYPQTEARRADWLICNAGNIPGFSAVAYYFAQKLNRELHIPIGIINSSWGGTSIKAWISEAGIAAIPEYKLLLDSFRLRRNTASAIDSVYARNWKVSNSNNAAVMAADKGYAEQWPKGEKGDAVWQPIDLPGTWQTGELKDFDGVLWFRKEIELPADVKDGAYFIHFGRNLGTNEAYINGLKVGTGSYFRGTNRFYLKQGALVPGKNIIVLRAFEKEKNAGFEANAQEMVIESLDAQHPKRYPIAGHWEFTTTITLQQTERLQTRLEPAPPNTTVSSIFNVKINPLLPLALKGVLWYQGENDAPIGYFYRKLLHHMITDWRTAFQQPKLPFIIAQLPIYGRVKNIAVEDGEWPDIRESQAAALSLPNTAMAVTLDVGDPLDIHPHNKKPVGERMANAALVMAYSQPDYPLSPMMESFSIQGKEVHIKFNHVGKGLLAKKNGPLKGFAIAGADKKFVWADAKIISNNEIVISQDAVATPVSVRYAWANSPVEANLVNQEGIPAAPFRTDDWPLPTQGKIDNK